MHDMFYGASPEIFRKARMLRINPTRAEKLLWEKLSKNQLGGFKFRRQHPIDCYIADFYCHAVKLVVELDGEIHEDNIQKAYDQGREYEIRGFGISILRFKNAEVYQDIDTVLETIRRNLQLLISKEK